MIKIYTNLVLCTFLIYSCSNINEYERRNIELLNNKYTDYSFRGSGDVYLEVNINKAVIDTIELKSIYDEAVLDKDSAGQTINKYKKDLTWIYMNVYQNKKFLFQISKDIYGDKDYKFLNTQYY